MLSALSRTLGTNQRSGTLSVSTKPPPDKSDWGNAEEYLSREHFRQEILSSLTDAKAEHKQRLGM